MPCRSSFGYGQGHLFYLDDKRSLMAVGMNERGPHPRRVAGRRSSDRPQSFDVLGGVDGRGERYRGLSPRRRRPTFPADLVRPQRKGFGQSGRERDHRQPKHFTRRAARGRGCCRWEGQERRRLDPRSLAAKLHSLHLRSGRGNRRRRGPAMARRWLIARGPRGRLYDSRTQAGWKRSAGWDRIAMSATPYRFRGLVMTRQLSSPTWAFPGDRSWKCCPWRMRVSRVRWLPMAISARARSRRTVSGWPMLPTSLAIGRYISLPCLQPAANWRCPAAEAWSLAGVATARRFFTSAMWARTSV